MPALHVEAKELKDKLQTELLRVLDARIHVADAAYALGQWTDELAEANRVLGIRASNIRADIQAIEGL